MTKIWPCTIIPARYGGCYENGSWLAFPCEYDAIPEDVYGSDIPAMIWWESPAADMVGRGATPDAAIANLRERVSYDGEFLDQGERLRWERLCTTY
jgi:hypothetical protein